MSKCFLCLRIDADAFVKELRELDFTVEEALEVVGWVRMIYEAEPTFLCGYSSKAIKAALAYVGVKTFNKVERKRNDWGFFIQRYSQRNIAEHFDLTEVALRHNYQRISKFMLKNIPEVI